MLVNEALLAYVDFVEKHYSDGQLVSTELPNFKPVNNSTICRHRRVADEGCFTQSWLWTFVAKSFTVFVVRATRAATAVGDFLTCRFGGLMICKRLKMYWSRGHLLKC